MTARAFGAARFVGRSRELAELRGWLADARAGRGRMSVLRGEPGIGKTRLTEELAAEADAVGIPTAWGRCSADSGAPALWPLRRIIGQLPGDHEQFRAIDDDLFGSSSEGLAAARFAHSVWLADAIVAAAVPDGLLVIVEDLHWADSATIGALNHLAAELSHSRALVVVTARLATAAEPDAEAGLLERPGVEQRKLSGLGRGDITEYLSGLGGGGPVDERYADLVLRLTAGNSLYVAAVARLLTEGVSLRTYDAAGSSAALSGRSELLDLSRGPMSRVSAECREMVEFASIAGEEFDVLELSTAMQLPTDAVLGLVDEAELGGLLTRPADTLGAARFVHALIRDGVYDSVDNAARSRAHRALAAAIEADARGLERIGAVAGHLTRGAASPADHLRAAAYARKAGRKSLTDRAYAEAAGQFGSAIYSLTMAGGASATERAENMLDLAFAEYRSGTFVGAMEHCAQAADMAEAQQRWDLLARAALLVDGVDLGDNSTFRLCERALALLPESELSLRAQLQARMAYAAAERGDVGEAGTMSAQALTLAEQTAEPAALVAALRARHQALAGPGHAAERQQLGARAIDLAERGEPLAEMWGRLWRIDAAFEQGDLIAVDQELSALARLAAQLRFPMARWHLLRLGAAREAVVGRFAVAEEQAGQARSLADELDDPSVIPLYYAFLMFLCYTRGQPPDDLLTDAEMASFRAMAERIALPIASASVASVMVSAGELDEALRISRRLVGEADSWPIDGRWIVTVSMLADVACDVGDTNSAELLYPMLAPFADLAIAGGSGTVACEGSAARRLGRLAALCGRLGEAEDHLRDAISFEERMGARPFTAISRMYLADVLHARGGTSNLVAAGSNAREALRTMLMLDMPGRAERCRQILAAIDADAAQLTSLTPREREIVVLVADGRSNRQIAEQLFVSERTVETHVSHVLAKLGASKRIDIATWAVAGGLSTVSGQT
ncbi:MAG: ATP-binding protein [Geodermatophilaceae bacterium]